MDILFQVQAQFQQPVDHLKQDITSLRTGRANSALIENVMVDAYGTQMTITSVAAVAVPDARTLTIEPWDKNLLKEIERAIQESKLGINPVVQGQMIRLTLPMLTEETRKNLVKTLSEKLEHARIGVRGVRDSVKAEIVAAERDKQITEDEKYKMLEQLDKIAAGYNERIKHVGEEKEKEIMTM